MLIGISLAGRANCDVNWAEYKSERTYVAVNHRMIVKNLTLFPLYGISAAMGFLFEMHN